MSKRVVRANPFERAKAGNGRCHSGAHGRDDRKRTRDKARQGLRRQWANQRAGERSGGASSGHVILLLTSATIGILRPLYDNGASEAKAATRDYVVVRQRAGGRGCTASRRAA
jgi:hypothetical protein